MANSAWSGARIAQQTDAPNGGLYLAELLRELEPWVYPSFANSAARNTALNNWIAAGNTAVPGMRAHTLDDGRDWVYDGGAWVWPKGAQGELGYVERDTGAGPVSTTTSQSISGTQVSVTIPSARIIRATACGQIVSDAGNTAVALTLANTTTGKVIGYNHVVSVANQPEQITVIMRQSLAAGTYSYELRLSTAGSGSGNAFTSATPLTLTIEDLGSA